MQANNPILFWLAPWEPSATLMFIAAVTALLFIRGSMQTAISWPRKLYFWAGFLSLYIVSHTRYDYYSEHVFFMHRIQHSVLHHMAPFLIALSRPGAALWAGMPPRLRPSIQKLLNSSIISGIAKFMNQPFIAVALFIGLIIFWLTPSIHFIAMLDWRLYRVMNWGMALNGLMFWSLVLNNYALKPAKLSATCRIAMMLAIIPPQIVIGLLIFLAPHELYPIYTLCGRAFALSPLADQQLGGLILWVPAAMMSVLGIIFVMRREWMPVTRLLPDT